MDILSEDWQKRNPFMRGAINSSYSSVKFFLKYFKSNLELCF